MGISSVQSQAVSEPLVRVSGITKRFPQVLANDNVSLTIQPGEIHCLLGENGAGKSTLAEMLYGVHRPDAGTIWHKGTPVTLSSPKVAIQLGIGMVHQHFILVPTLSVVENVVIGTDSAGFRLDLKQAKRRLEALCAAYGIVLNPDAEVGHLCVGEQQWVEILKALYVGVELLILDEPTAALTPQETDKLFAILRKMREDGLSILFITHKLKEVMAVSDRVTVLRKGRLVDTVNTADVSQRDLARLMVGREVVLQLDRGSSVPGEILLEVEGLRTTDDRGIEALQGVSFSLRRNEILGLAGVSGNGQKELFDVLTGVRKATGGHVLLQGKNITNRSPASIATDGVASVPEDRIHQGLIMDFRVDENLVLGLQRRPPFSRGPFLSQAGIGAFATELIGSYEIATPSAGQITRVLSGGNLQKMLMARELSQSPKCLIVSQPTRGLDVGATEYVRRRILKERDRGAAVLLISEDLDEIFGLCNRIAVMFKGKIAGVLAGEDASLEEVGLLMAGCEVAA